MYKNNDRNPIRFTSVLSYPVLMLLLILVALTKPVASCAQENVVQPGRLIHMTSSHTAFPDQKRMPGYTYDSQFYSAAEHYSDSSVLILVPKNLGSKTVVNMVFWFHGWRNNIDTALGYFHLAEQFESANRDAILVLAETAKNAPDSYGGRLENQGVFANLVKDVLEKLVQEKILHDKPVPGKIVLAGHSGAYRVIAGILQQGGMPVQEVQLFDALYADDDVFGSWLAKDSSHRFINWFTNHGGTDGLSRKMMVDLKNAGSPFLFAEEKDCNNNSLAKNNIIFVHSEREHNDIIFHPDTFRLLLEGSVLEKNKR